MARSHRTVRALVLAALVATAACGSAGPVGSPESSPQLAVAVPVAPALTIGEAHVYTLDWQTEATRTGEKSRVSGGLHLQGELHVSAIAHGPEGTRASVWLSSLKRRELSLQGQAVELDEETLAGPRAELLIADDGAVRRVFFAPDSAPVFRELMTGVIARLDLRGATADTAPRQVRGGHGLVEVMYHRDDSGAVIRELGSVLRFDTAPGVEVDREGLVGHGRIELDDSRVPVRIELRDSAMLAEQLGLVADDRFTLVRTRIEQAVVPALVDPIEIDPTDEPDQRAIALALDRQYAQDVTMDDLEIAMTTVDGGVLPRAGEVSRAAALLRGWPERTAELQALAMGAGSHGRQLAFDLLASAGTPEAQRAMCALLAEPVAASWRERALLVQRFAFVGAPTSETAEFLLAQAAAAEHAGDETSLRAVLHPLGTVTGRLEDPWLAERLHRVLVDAAGDEDGKVRAAAISGLGNARRRDDLERLIAATRDDDAGVRVEAVAALRTHVIPKATAALLAALDDADPAVASRALNVLHERHFEGEADPELLARARSGEYNRQLDRAMASALYAHREDADVRVALAAIASRTAEPDLGL